MSPTPRFPGVFIEEVPSGARTIPGVATSIVAFIGRAVTGPVDHPVSIASFADFERTFGGLHVDYPLGYAVQQFYQNGGSHAVIVRLYKPEADKATHAVISVAGIDPAKPLLLMAKYPGAAANALRARVDSGVSTEVAAQYGLTRDDLFNLTVGLVSNGPLETMRNLTIKESPRRVDRVLAAESSLVGIADFSAIGFPEMQGDPVPRGGPWNDETASTGVTITATDGAPLDDATFVGNAAQQTGIYALDGVDLFNLLCIPPDARHGDVPVAVYRDALDYCAKRRAMLIVDAPAGWKDAADVTENRVKHMTDLGLDGAAARNAAIFFPRILALDPLRNAPADTFVACGAVAGVIARTDVQRGVWKTPAGIDATINGIVGLKTRLNDLESALLNPLGINCLRSFPTMGSVVWGSRTLRGADAMADDYKYVSVRRLAMFIEESVERGTQWAVFEPNDVSLWAQIRFSVDTFMLNLFRQGAFQGETPTAAYFVKCGNETTAQNDIDLGLVNITIGFAPLKPAEFVVVQIQQVAGRARG
jgi:phage tail sheath protein FI